MWKVIKEDELYHHGIKGQKWGVRRFQNPDGTLTAAGRKRYTDENGRGDSSGNGRKRGLTDRQKKAIKVGAAIAGTTAVAALAAYAGSKYVKEAKEVAAAFNAHAETRDIISKERKYALNEIERDYGRSKKDRAAFEQYIKKRDEEMAVFDEAEDLNRKDYGDLVRSTRVGRKLSPYSTDTLFNASKPNIDAGVITGMFIEQGKDAARRLFNIR